jgi:hypothetical protein
MEKLDEPEPSFDVEAVEERVVGLSLAPSGERQPKMRKAPRKWTDDETEHLFQGVVKHGLGKWKSILEDASFSFENRTAVDLKDRYRVCTSGPNKIRHVIEAQRAGEPLTPSSSSTINMRVSSEKMTDGTEAHAGGSSPPPEAPSTKRTTGRRVRRAWTSDEDENLLKGVVKHGFQWTAIHDDKELDLSHRKATDLRDRIRNKFPEGYRNAETAPPKSQIQKAASKGSHDNTGAAATRKRKVPKNRSEGQKTEATKSSRLVEGADGCQEQPGRTLPPLDIDDEDWDWNNNTLPPLLDWEEMGI